jgi:N-acetyl-gamma-glutamylphosphate reductase
MTTGVDQAETRNDLSNALKSWVMIALTFIFVILYATALIGWLKPLADEKMIVRLEPIIFVIIGYYFGRLPSQQNENTLKGEINRQTQKADAAQHNKEQAQQTREALEEKVRNVRATLTSAAPGITAKGFAESADTPGAVIKEDALRHSVIAALSVLNS